MRTLRLSGTPQARAKNGATNNGSIQLFRTGALALLLSGFAGASSAQSDAWVIGDQWAAMGEAGTSIPLQPLPEPLPAGANKYAGQIATKSSTARRAPDGGLLFFAIDGNIYDGDGYLIADGKSSSCTYCIEPGSTGEFFIVPVPGQCSQFFVITSRPINFPSQGEAKFLVSLLDMEADNPWWTDPFRRGRIVDLDTEISDPVYAALEPWFASVPFDTYEAEFGNTDNELKSPYISMAIMDPQWSEGSQLLHVTAADRVRQYKITSTGLVSTWTRVIKANTVTAKMEVRDTDFGIDESTDEILFAVTDCALRETPSGSGDFRILVMRLDPATGVVNSVTGYDPDPADPDCGNNSYPGGVYGCAFSPSGELLYFTSETDNYLLGVIDLATATVTDLTSLSNLTIPSPANRTRTHLNIGLAAGGTAPALYYAHSTGLAALVGPDDPTTATWVDPVPFSTTLNSVPQLATTAGGSAPAVRQLDAQVFRDAYPATLTSGACCVFASTIEAEPGRIIDDSQSNIPGTAWEPGDNPFPGDPTEVVFTADVVVETGTTLYVDGMTWRFTENARLVVEVGAFVYFTNGYLTSLVCEGERWPGILVNGTSSDPTQSASQQGRLYLVNSEVSNAEVGIWCATLTNTIPPQIDAGGYGGRAVAVNTVFRNNISGVDITRYHRFNSGGVPQYNRCQFNACSFITDSDWPDLGVNYPSVFAYFYDVDDLRLTDCTFRNDAHTLWTNPNHWGRGIVAINATTTCKGNMNFTDHQFANLRIGVQATNGSPLFINTVDGMGFLNNWYGMIDQADVNAQITHNRFEPNLDTQFPGGASTIGLELWQCEDYTVEDNLFIKPSAAQSLTMGIWFKGPSYNDNRIYDNDFSTIDVGCLIEGVHVGTGGPVPNTLPGVQMLCGTHTDNWIDQALLPQSYIRALQGIGSSGGTGTANNLFSEDPSCTSGFSVPWVNIVDLATAQYSLHVDYHYYHWTGGTNPHLRPDCVEDIYGVAESNTGNWFYDLHEHPQPVPFDEPTHCGVGDLDQFGGSGGSYLSAIQLNQAELGSAVDAYYGQVDGGSSPDLQAEIEEDSPWHPSYYLRDLLIANSPLSDHAMYLAINRGQPMDQWHLTQVLIQNSPLTNYIRTELENANVLSPYFMALLQQYNQGMSLRKLLEMEVIQRGQEKAQLERLYFMTVAQDSTMTDKADSIASVFEADTMYNGLLNLYRHYLSLGDYTGAATLESELTGLREAEAWLELGALATALDGDWHTADAQQREDILALAFSDNEHASAAAWAIATAIGELDSIPPSIFPSGYRSALYFSDRSELPGVPTLGITPNPATDQVVFSYAEGLEDGTIEIYDPMGRMVQQVPLKGQKALTVASIGHLTTGLYTARLMLDGFELGTNRFTIAR